MGLKEDVEKINNKVEEVSFAYELLQDARKTNKRMFTIILVILGMWFITGCYLVYILNDIGVIEETTTQEVTDIDTIKRHYKTMSFFYDLIKLKRRK